MTLRYLLDTGTLSSVIASKPSRLAIRRITQRTQQCAIASVVWSELLYGCARLPDGKRKAELENFLSEVVHKSFPVLAYDRDAAGWHGVERARLELAGRPKPFVDGQIAAIASVNDLVLVTTNVKDFVGFKDLAVEDWTKER